MEDSGIKLLIQQDTRKYTELERAFLQKLPYLGTLLNHCVAKTTDNEIKYYDMDLEWYNDIVVGFFSSYRQTSMSEKNLAQMERNFMLTEKEKISASWNATLNHRKRIEPRKRTFPKCQQQANAHLRPQLEPTHPTPAPTEVRKNFLDIVLSKKN